jgi:tetratricopeptide (TPR) repeat protein
VYATDASVEKELGNSLYQQSQYAEAIKHYSEAILATSSGQALSVLYANRAACYFKLKQYLLAIEDCDRSVQSDANYSNF